MAVRVLIEQGGNFVEVNALASDLVFWKNDDTTFPSHSPFGLKVNSGGVSDAIQPQSQPITKPTVLNYKCTEHGETGVLNLYNDFVAVAAPKVTGGTAPVAKGGCPPYTMSAADVAIQPPTPEFSLGLAEGSPAGINAILTNPPANFTVTFTLSANDSLGNEISQQPITITV